jgi:hypothetical protein
MATHFASSKWWGGIGQCARGGGAELKPNSKTEPPGLSFGQRNVGGVRFRVEVILFGKRTQGLRWWGGAIGQCARRAELERQSKTEPLGLGFGQSNVGGFIFG